MAQMKKGVMLINTSRGGLIDSNCLAANLKNGKIGYLGLDVYEEEEGIFFEDFEQDPRALLAIELRAQVQERHALTAGKRRAKTDASTHVVALAERKDLDAEDWLRRVREVRDQLDIQTTTAEIIEARDFGRK